MRRRGGLCAEDAQPFQDCDSKRRALYRVGSRAQLVYEHQAARAGLL